MIYKEQAKLLKMIKKSPRTSVELIEKLKLRDVYELDDRFLLNPSFRGYVSTADFNDYLVVEISERGRMALREYFRLSGAEVRSWIAIALSSASLLVSLLVAIFK